MKRLMLILFVITLLQGCVTTHKARIIIPKTEQTDSKIGQIQTKTLGEPMVVKADLRSYPAFVALKDFQVPSFGLGLVYPKIYANSLWICKHQLKDGDYLCSNPLQRRLSPGFNWDYCLIINEEGEAYGDSSCETLIYNKREWTEGKQKIFKPITFYEKGSFKQELIYNGRAGNVIKISYREYKDDMARPAFFQDLSYDLSESKNIGFRGMIIEVIEATNTFIKFIVKSEMQ